MGAMGRPPARRHTMASSRLPHGDPWSLSMLNEALRIASAIKSPPPAKVAAIAHLDQDQLRKDLNDRRTLRETERELASYPTFGTLSADTLTTASALGRLPLLEIYRDNTPPELISIASETVQNDRRLKDAIHRFCPVLELFGLDGACTTDAFVSAARAIVAWTKIQPEHRPALLLNQDIDEAAFGRLFKRWNDLLAKEAEWRRSLSAYGDQAWPTAATLRSASELLKKGKVGFAIEAMKGRTKPVHELLARMGLTAAQDPSSRLVALAGHVDALEEFESDDQASSLLGASWLGLETKFRMIEYGIRARKYLTDHAGDDIAARLMGITAQDAPRLQSFEPAAASLVREVSSRPGGLVGRSVNLTEAMLTDSIASMERVAAADPRGLLKTFDITVRELAGAAKLESDRRALVDALAKSPLSADLARLDAAQTDVDQMLVAVEWLKTLREVAPAPSLLQQLSSPDAEEEFKRLSLLSEQATPHLRQYADKIQALRSGFGFVDLDDAQPVSVAEKLRPLLDRKQELPEFLGLRHERRGLEELGLGDFLKRADAARIAPSRLPQLLESAISRRGATLARRSAQPLQNNTGASLEARRRQFAEKDRAKIRDDRIRIKAKLMTKKPSPGSNVGRRRTWTEMALIANEIGKERGFVPVRTLLAQAGMSVQALKPCFMMSPLSLAKFMKAGSLSFDMLVIDEASQMRPEDALGAMLRSKQIVVVGDQKQLPPTDFFARSGDGGSDEEDLDDYDDESILESCQKTFGLRRPLRWHYRSRCESLIRFSNERFYKRELITFPASKPSSFSIDLVRVAGTFQARCNPVEASRVAEEAITFMRHHAALNESDVPSLGLVALNIQQRDLIQEEFNRLITDDVLVEQYREKVANRGEEFFIKNLENVQGDERDFVFISMTYGPEPGSTVLKQRFGPINRKQGHRRLNVLFSRARTRIGLFTSFSSSDVRPTSDSAEGVHVLQKYLEYAETRGRMTTNPGGDGEPDSDFETEVADRLRARGFTVDYQVGASGYKIDLGVRHPDFAERYLAGIECDGAAYHSSKSARDRDRLREEVLNDKGWQILRVWSTDWFDDPALQTDRLVAKIEALRARPTAVEDDYVVAKGSELEARAEDLPTPAQDLPVEHLPPNAHIVSLAEPDIDARPAEGSLSEAECFEALRRLRDGVIAVEVVDWEAHRSLLRDAMIETFVRQRITDPDQWFGKIPGYLRQGTNPIEKSRYLERVCDIVGRLRGDTAFISRLPASRTGQVARN
ncbi:hypothetical protein FBF71_28000 [Bradyrhizobium elkanii]|nr:hypothetical protein [Bradyrhizobium elkanii]